MRLVLDTNVVVSGLLWNGTEHDLLGLADRDDVQLVTSLPMLAELSDVLGRPKFRTKLAASGLSVDRLVAIYAAVSIIVRPTAIPRVAPDADDDVVIVTAIAARADYIVTGDRMLMTVDTYTGIRLVAARTIHELLCSR